MRYRNQMTLTIAAEPENEGFARSAVAGYVARLNPTVEELGDIKTAVSEAVTNCIVHGYGYGAGEIAIGVRYEERLVTVTVTDNGKGIPDIGRAMQPFFTTRPEEERSGMGFTVMQAFTDELFVTSVIGSGTTVTMKKLLKELKADEP